MSGRRGWLSMWLPLRLGRYRWLLQFPSERRGWRIALAVVVLLAGYVVGAVPTVIALGRSGLWFPYGEPVCRVFYAPLYWLDAHVPLFHAFLLAEGDFLQWLFSV